MSDIDSDAASVPTEEQQTLNLVRQLLGSFQYGRSGMVFACGGKLPIPVANNMAQQSSKIVGGEQPVVLRWDPRSQYVPARVCKLQFPLKWSDSSTVNNLHQLFEDMQPATFGYRGQDVLDESYRNASKLDPSHFDCTFNPYEVGIIDEVAQILLPGIKTKNNLNTNSTSASNTGIKGSNVMRAELYKLNVYSGPSGHFKAHVDTPRSNEQIGSLVVCLPSVHQGGQLEVRHRGRSVTFDWSMPVTARPEIQWAAFYSDCEHEVTEVTAGHRITLTYNLYARDTSSTGPLQAGRGLLDPTQLPMYGILHSLLLQENFMPDGGYLGVHTSHAYPHTSKSACLPATLKGTDMAVWETFRSLGCGVKLRPIVELAEWYHYGHELEDENEDDCPAVELTDASSGDLYDPDEDERSEIGSNESRASQEDDDRAVAAGSGASTSGSEHSKISADELQALLKNRDQLPSGYVPASESPELGTQDGSVPQREDDSEDEESDRANYESRRNAGGCRVLGNNLRFHTDHGFPVESSEHMQRLLEKWMDKSPREPKDAATQPERLLYEEVAWLNRSGRHREPQIAYTAYGNDARPDMMYSTCGIVAEVPPYTTRKALLGKE